MNILSHMNLRKIHPDFQHVNKKTEVDIKYTATDGSVHDIRFCNLLKQGYHFNMPAEIEGVAWTEPKDGGYDFSNIGKLDYLIFDERGQKVPNSILNQRGGEFVFVPKEKI